MNRTLAKLMIGLLAVFLTAPQARALAGDDQPLQQKLISVYGDAFLEEVNGLPVLHLKGTPSEMGFQYGVLAGDKVLGTVNKLDEIASRNKDLKVVPKWVLRPLKKLLGWVFWLQFQKDEKDEINGIVAGAKSVGVKVSKYDIAFINSIIDLGGILKPLASLVQFGPKGQAEAEKRALNILGLGWLPTNNCDSMAVWGSRTQEGKTFQTRNVDIDTGMGLEDIPMVIVYKRTGHIPYVTAAFQGMIGIFTGMSARGIGLGQVWGFSSKTGLGNPWAFQIKSVFSKAGTAPQAAEMFGAQKKWTYGSNFVFADAFGKGVAMEVNRRRFVAFTDDDPKEDLAKWNGQIYAIRLKEAVFRGDAAMDPELRKYQDASNGPDGDPRESNAYQKRYKGQADRIIAYQEAGVKMGHAEAEAISRETAARGGSLQAAVYANTDRLLWVSYAKYLPDGSLQQAYDGDYHYIPFRDYLAEIHLDKDGVASIVGDQWVPESARPISDLELVVKHGTAEYHYTPSMKLRSGDVLDLRVAATGFVVDRKQIR